MFQIEPLVFAPQDAATFRRKTFWRRLTIDGNFISFKLICWETSTPPKQTGLSAEVSTNYTILLIGLANLQSTQITSQVISYLFI